MTDPITHRGPDSSGLWTDAEAGIALAHRRLSIVDLSPHGHQPMLSPDGRFVLTFNGEIYNHGAIRAELEQAGSAPQDGWRGHSDTETLVQAISVWGLEQTLDRAVGMFALGLWDRRERRLSLVRDRFGEKPLYYGWVGGNFLFASELKSIRAHPRFDNAIDPAAVQSFVARLYIPAPQSIYRRIFKLPPGTVLELGAESASQPRDEAPVMDERRNGLSLRTYWSYADVVQRGLKDPIHDEREALDRLDDALSTAIKGQSVADVPVGAFLSGGLDSSTVVALYQKHSPKPVRSFTIGFHEPGFNEADHAKAIAAHLGTIHDERYVTAAEAQEVIPSLPSMFDEPFADPSQIPTYLVSKFAREQVTVALSGDGGDELFTGYGRHLYAMRMWKMIGRVPWPVRAAGRPFGRIPPRAFKRLAALGGRGSDARFIGQMHKAVRIAGSARSFDDVYASLLHQWPYEAAPIGLPPSPAAGFPLQLHRAPDTVRMTYCDAMAYLPDDILCKVDRAAMAVSLETRVPFLDHRVAEVAARIPLSMKVRDGKGKHIIRDLLGRELPRELFERPKSGFALPVGEWVKGPLRAWAEELLEPSRMQSDGWFDPRIVQRRWTEHLRGERNSTDAIWAILMFQSWLRA